MSNSINDVNNDIISGDQQVSPSNGASFATDSGTGGGRGRGQHSPASSDVEEELLTSIAALPDDPQVIRGSIRASEQQVSPSNGASFATDSGTGGGGGRSQHSPASSDVEEELLTSIAAISDDPQVIRGSIGASDHCSSFVRS
jgi:hypothetical protein